MCKTCRSNVRRSTCRKLLFLQKFNSCREDLMQLCWITAELRFYINIYYDEPQPSEELGQYYMALHLL
jgi:hypothetical protein